LSAGRFARQSTKQSREWDRGLSGRVNSELRIVNLGDFGA
jgi:hypothetical protein